MDDIEEMNDVKEMQLDLEHTKLHCRILKTDIATEAAGKDVEKAQASEYRKIIVDLLAEQETKAKAPGVDPLSWDEVRRSLAREKVHRRMLEADRDAERAAKEAERARVLRYRHILSRLDDGEEEDLYG
jgi:transposase